MCRSPLWSLRGTVGLSALLAACDDSTGPAIEEPTGTGVIQVTTTTTGTSLDSNGYRVFLNDRPHHYVGPNDRVLIPNIPTGAYRVSLGDVSPNCTVVEGGHRDPVVERRTTTTIDYFIDCAYVELQVTTATTGVNLDPDGYQVQVYGPYDYYHTLPLAFDAPVAASGSTSFVGLEHWIYEVLLVGVAQNCAVQGKNPEKIRYPYRSSVEFLVECSPIDA